MQKTDQVEIIQEIQKAPDVFYKGMTWKLWNDQILRAGQLQIDIDHFLLELHHAGHIPPVMRLWQNHACLVVSRSDARLPEYGAAELFFKDKNIPLYIRTSGGTVVPHGPGVLNISLIFSRVDENITLERSYIILCDLVAEAMVGMGLLSDIRDVAGSFCDGRFNLTIEGRKVGGTAQRIKIHHNGRKSFLSHMCLLLDLDLREVVQDISDFYSLCGVSSNIQADSITTLAKERREVAVEGSTLSLFLKSFHKSLITP
ncbi:MAG: hypothetical protein JKY45_10850 [Emcibacter sp.]|nr:hypothetical protein [Emcibacter sp.]